MKDNVMEKVNVDKTEVLRYLGYNNQPLSVETETMIDSLIDRCMHLAIQSYTYKTYEIDDVDKGIYVKKLGLVFPGLDIRKHLDGCDNCVIMAVTCGMGVERELLRLQRVSMTEAVIFDACANTYVESLADCVQSLVEEEARAEGKYITDRYSPGYGDFPLDMQRLLVPGLECEKRLGLTVTDSSLLIPHKSVTAVIGLRDTVADKIKRNCKDCNMYDTCTMRKNGDRCVK